MLALIYDGQRAYISTVFAEKETLGSSLVAVFDADASRVEVIDKFTPNGMTPRVLFTQSSPPVGKRSGWKIYEDIALDWFIPLLKGGGGHEVDEYFVSKYVFDASPDDWQEISTEAQALAFNAQNIGLYVGTVAMKEGDDGAIEIFIDTAADFRIELRLYGVIDGEAFGRIYNAYEAGISLVDGGFELNICGDSSEGVDGYDRNELVSWSVVFDSAEWRVEFNPETELAEAELPEAEPYTIDKLFSDIGRSVDGVRLENGRIFYGKRGADFVVEQVGKDFDVFLNGVRYMTGIAAEDACFVISSAFGELRISEIEKDIYYRTPLSIAKTLATVIIPIALLCIGNAAYALFLLFNSDKDTVGNAPFILFISLAAMALLVFCAIKYGKVSGEYVLTGDTLFFAEGEKLMRVFGLCDVISTRVRKLPFTTEGRIELVFKPDGLKLSLRSMKNAVKLNAMIKELSARITDGDIRCH